MKSTAVAVAAPAIGPAIVTVAGIDVPVAAIVLSVAGLLLARYIAPPPLRRLNAGQERALTCLLLIVLVLIVTGQFPFFGGKPMGAGMATICGMGLGMSGLLVIEFFGERFMDALRAGFSAFSRNRDDT